MPTINERKFELKQNCIYVNGKKLNNYDRLDIICEECGTKVSKAVKRFKKFYKEHEKCLCQKHQTEYMHMLNYGVKNCMMNKDISRKAQNTQKQNNNGKLAFNTEKRTKTMLKRYGVEYSGQSNELLKKAQKTNLKRYGNICSLGNKIIINKSEETKLKKYGNKKYNNILKAQNTNLDKYGTKCSLQNKDVKEKCKQTLYNNYGVTHPSKIEGMQDRMTSYFMNKYGVKRPAQLYEFKIKMMKTARENNSNNKCAWFNINGQKVQGKFELKVAKFLVNNNINFIAHNGLKFKKYKKENKLDGLYAPDFYLLDYDLYLEPHSNYYWDDKFEWKMQEIKKQVNILYFNEKYNIENILEVLNANNK